MSPCSRTVRWIEFSDPLLSPSSSKFENTEALATIYHPHLFAVSTPINVDRFERLLLSHPNQPFVRSVLHELREGFWPFANTHYREWPLTWDNSGQPPCAGTAESKFIESQIKDGQGKGQFLAEFGPHLLLGMYSMPIHPVPKPGSDNIRLIADHSTGEFALNNTISKEDIAGVTLDNVQDLDAALRAFHAQYRNVDVLLWKADVSEMPMHPLWQIKQVMSVGTCWFVDQWNVFGGRASQRIFHAFMSLMTWIAVIKLLITIFMIYVDDSYLAQCKGKMLFYR